MVNRTWQLDRIRIIEGWPAQFKFKFSVVPEPVLWGYTTALYRPVVTQFVTSDIAHSGKHFHTPAKNHTNLLSGH